MRIFSYAASAVMLFSLVSCCGQGASVPTDFRAVEYNEIEGANKLGQPFFLRGSEGEPFYVEKAAYAYPAIYDINGDGKKDLLIGEFGGGKSANVLAFANEGSAKKPVFGAQGEYLTDVNSDKLFISGY